MNDPRRATKMTVGEIPTIDVAAQPKLGDIWREVQTEVGYSVTPKGSRTTIIANPLCGCEVRVRVLQNGTHEIHGDPFIPSAVVRGVLAILCGGCALGLMFQHVMAGILFLGAVMPLRLLLPQLVLRRVANTLKTALYDRGETMVHLRIAGQLTKQTVTGVLIMPIAVFCMLAPFGLIKWPENVAPVGAENDTQSAASKTIDDAIETPNALASDASPAPTYLEDVQDVIESEPMDIPEQTALPVFTSDELGAALGHAHAAIQTTESSGEISPEVYHKFCRLAEVLTLVESRDNARLDDRKLAIRSLVASLGRTSDCAEQIGRLASGYLDEAAPPMGILISGTMGTMSPRAGQYSSEFTLIGPFPSPMRVVSEHPSHFERGDNVILLGLVCRSSRIEGMQRDFGPATTEHELVLRQAMAVAVPHQAVSKN